MYKPPLQINTGAEEYVIPSVEGCLKDRAGKFYSTQNAVRVYEWLRGSETDPLVLESKVVDGILPVGTQRRFGFGHVNVYPERWYAGQLLSLEQHLLAVPAILDTIKRNLDRAATNAPGNDPEAFTLTLNKLMGKLSMVSAFNASAMFFQHPIPQRACFESLETLDLLCACVLTQRNKRIYENPIGRGNLPPVLPTMYNKLELDKVIGRIHGGIMEGFFPNPAQQAKADGLLDESFYRQCAMAFSITCTVPIPTAYFESTPGPVFYWACSVLEDLKKRVPSFQVRPKIQNVTNLFTKPQE